MQELGQGPRDTALDEHQFRFVDFAPLDERIDQAGDRERQAYLRLLNAGQLERSSRIGLRLRDRSKPPVDVGAKDRGEREQERGCLPVRLCQSVVEDPPGLDESVAEHQGGRGEADRERIASADELPSGQCSFRDRRALGSGFPSG